MGSLVWSKRPTMRGPVVVAAFSGWNDAGDAATTAVRFLRDSWRAEHFAGIDPEEYVDFSSTRPLVSLRDGRTREIVWPPNDFYAAPSFAGSPDVVLLLGTEPQLRWRSFCRDVLEVASALEARLVITLGALLADVPHRRPVSLMGTAGDDVLIERYGLRRSRYEGPTGIVGVLQDACTHAGLPAVSLWAAVPAYVPGATSPKAAAALVRRTGELLDLPIDTTDLEVAAVRYEIEVDEALADDDNLRSYVVGLEHAYDEAGGVAFDDDDDEDDGEDLEDGDADIDDESEIEIDGTDDGDDDGRSEAGGPGQGNTGWGDGAPDSGDGSGRATRRGLHPGGTGDGARGRPSPDHPTAGGDTGPAAERLVREVEQFLRDQGSS